MARTLAYPNPKMLELSNARVSLFGFGDERISLRKLRTPLLYSTEVLSWATVLYSMFLSCSRQIFIVCVSAANLLKK